MEGNKKIAEKRRELVSQIKATLENGTPIWQQPWVNVMRRQENCFSHRRYRGINAVILSFVSLAKGYTDNRWMTFRQMSENNLSFRGNAKGQGVAVFFYLWETVTKDDGSKEEEFRGVKTYTVFNASLTNARPIEVKLPDVFEELAAGERMIAASPVPFIYGGDVAAYNYSSDCVKMPERAHFLSAEGFYGTAFHEMTHSTGAASRLARNIKSGFGSPDYAREELVAELGSVFLLSMLDLPVVGNGLENNVSYIKSWMEALEDSKEFFSAVDDAEKASDFLFSLYKEKNDPVPLISEGADVIQDVI